MPDSLNPLSYDFAVATIHALLDDADWETAYAEDRAMTLDQAIAYALKETDG